MAQLNKGSNMDTCSTNNAVNNQQLPMKPWSKLFACFASQKLKIVIAAFALVLFSVVDAGMIYFVKPLVDNGLAQSNSETLKMGALLVVLIFFIRGIASFIYNYTLAYVSSHITFDLRQQAFDKLQMLPMAYFDNCNRGSLISKLIYDTEQISQATSNALVTAFRESLIAIVLLGMMFYQSWQLSLVFIIVGPLIAFIIAKVTKRFKQVSIALQNSMGDITKVAEQSLSNHQEVLAYNMADKLSHQFLKVNNKNRQQMMKLATASSLSNPTIQLIASFSISAVLLLASHESIIQALTPGTFTMVLFAIGSLLRPLKKLTTVNQQLQRGIAAATSIFELLEQKQEVDIGKKSVKGQQLSIKLKHLNFSYLKGTKQTLSDISAVIPSNTSIAIVGETGSGKSTLANLLLRLYEVPDSSIFINNTPIEQYNLTSLRSNIAIVSQQIVLFDDSLANNILFGCKREVSRAQLEDIADKANVMSFASSLPLGLDNSIGENGCLLSGGQRQRIAIARAMLKDAPIIILDEATSALDNKSEFLIQEAFSRLGVNKTMVIIAHRLSTIEKADQIIVLKKGRIVERGNHRSLLENCSTYFDMHQQGFKKNGN
jgi:subfamily B ATP-binding cassette protein MsbA